MDLKERFENYESMPDAAVWQSVQKGLRRRKMLRYSAAVAMLTALIVMAVVAFWPSQMPVEVASPMVAKHETSPLQPVASAEIEPTVQVVQQEKAVVKAAEAVVTVTATDNVVEKETAEMETPANKHVASMPQQTVAMPELASVPTQPVVVEKQEAITMVAEPVQVTSEQDHSEPMTEKAALTDDKLQDVNQSYEAQIWVPNAFSPEDPSGGEVCTFKAVAKERANIKGFKMYIYNRAGALVFQSTDIDEAWDGTHRGQKCPAGNYVYIIELNDEYAGLQHTRGSVLLIR